MSIVHNNAIIGSSGNQARSYNLARSLRFRSSASAYLSRTVGTPTSQNTWTYSVWLKRGQLGISGNILSSNGTQVQTLFTSGDNFQFYVNNALNVFVTTQVFRDPSAWYHFVLAVNSGATGTNKVRLYVNGTEITSFSTDNRSSFSASAVNQSGTINTIGNYGQGLNNYFDGYMTEVNFIDGQQLTPSSFGESDTVTGVWKPKKYSGSYGTNGFYLNFSDNSAATAAAIGKDSSGNGNNWTPNNISLTAGYTYDSMTDVPTLTSATASNFATGNPLKTPSQLTISNGNLTVAASGSNIDGNLFSTIGVTSGKWYFEVTVSTNTNANATMGVGTASASANNLLGYNSTGWSFSPSSGTMYYYNNGSTYSTSVSGLAATGTYALAFDADAGKLWISDQNGSFSAVNSGNPTAGTGALFTNLVATNGLFPAIGHSSVGVQTTLTSINFGQRPLTYTAPTGFKALNTFNLPDSTAPAGNAHMTALTYSGNGTQVVTGTGFKPDLVWVKDRSSAYNNQLHDSVRGATAGMLVSNSTAAQDSGYQLVSFDSNGFTTASGNITGVNNSGDSFVAWQWKAGQGATSTNTNGSITSTVSVNASAGFSIVTYTAQTSGTGTVGHGLGVAPAFIITKNRSGTVGWNVYHQSLGGTQYIILNSTGAAQTSNVIWNDTSPTSSVFSFGTGFANSGTYVAYCWAEVAGFSKFGSYTGNGSTDGPFVYTGFRPKLVIAKRTDSADYWTMIDTARDPSNDNAVNRLYPNDSLAEDTLNTVDMLSNGFKIRSAGATSWNASGGTYIYMAFAENPFKNSLAR